MTDKNKIKILNEQCINQIAAGEVIENVASVIKELVENALDAKATDVHIETMGYGQGLVTIRDNGIGMDQEDMVLALERHATSKIRDVGDLDHLCSLGFRGEALPSIASVAKLKMHSASALNQGMELHIEGGKILGTRLTPRQSGTTMEVRSLFYNAPVRRRFQASLLKERAAIVKTLTHFVLCHPKLALSWHNDGKEEIAIRADDSLERRIEILLGEEYAASLRPIDIQEKPLHLWGMISKPTAHRPNRSGQYLFINGRAVQSSFISQQILEGYGTRLPTHRFPLLVLHLTLPPSWIDVNVHPQKKEVRLHQEEALKDFFQTQIDQALQHTTVIPIQMPTYEASISQEIWQVEEEQAPYEPTPSFIKTHLQVLDLIGSKYILVKRDGVLLIVQVSRACARILFEATEIPPDSSSIQTLLIPLECEFATENTSKLIDQLDHFKTLGFEIRHFGGNTFVVEALPHYVEVKTIQETIEALLSGERKKMRKNLTHHVQRKVTTFEEGKRIVDQLFACSVPHETPEGKPTFYELTEQELSQRLKT